MSRRANSADKPREQNFVREDDRWTVVIHPAAHQVLDRHRQKRLWSCEAGGQLFGTLHPGQLDVQAATGPSPGDWRSRFGFKPSRAREQADINYHFERGLHFLGNWHTHPDPAPEPSPTDRKSIRAEVTESEHQLPFFLLLIVGTWSDPATWWLSSHDPEEQRFRWRSSPPSPKSKR